MATIEAAHTHAPEVDARDAALALAIAERDAALADAKFLREYMNSARSYLAHVAEAAVADDLEVATDPPVAHGPPERTSLGTPTHVQYPASVIQVLHKDSPLRNRLLATLPPDELGRLEPHLALVRLRAGQTLFQPEVPIRYVYFPETAVVSLVSRLGGRGSVEVGTTGYEGMVGLPVFLAADTSTSEALAQIPGTARRMEAETFVRLAKAPGAFHHALLRYTQAFLTQVAQTAVCNTAHLVEERCARWLLMTRDRVNGNQFPLKYEFLAFMLAVRIGGVMMAMRRLQSAGLVLYDHERVSIVDRGGLEAAACECYGVVRAHFDRLLPAGG